MKHLLLTFGLLFGVPALAQTPKDHAVTEVSKCWSVGSASSDTMETVVTVDVEFRENGSVASVEIAAADGPNEAAIRSAFAAARIAVFRCADTRDLWRDETVSLRFNYKTMQISLVPRPAFKPLEI